MEIDDLMEEIRDLIEAAFDEKDSVQVEDLKDTVEMLEEEVAELQAECQDKDMEIERLRELIND